MYRRYRAVETFLYKARHEERVKTKIKIGREDLILYKKAPGSRYWRNCPSPNNLPPIDIEVSKPKHSYNSKKILY